MSLLETPFVNRVLTTALRGIAPLVIRTSQEIVDEFADAPGDRTTIEVPTRHGAVQCIVYSPPKGTAAPAIYLNFHGGGYLVRLPQQDDHICRALAVGAGVVVLNVDYDTTPQVKFPVAIEEGVDILNWVVDNADAQGWDGSRLIVGGQSAGGAIATAIARSARDAGGPRIALQVLNYPPLDLTVPGGEKPWLAEKPAVSPGVSRVLDYAYAPNVADRTHPFISPAYGPNLEPVDGVHPLAGMPPTHMQTAALDGLREEDHRYADALREAGVPVVVHEFGGVDHGFNIRPPVGPARESVDLMVEQVIDAIS
ncbi:MAG TPA: alpha/beta hydrolase [Pseudolysinimonas sp.]|nr:alpha/beta hydrolase [Pseudolysinimonas sp.]